MVPVRTHHSTAAGSVAVGPKAAQRSVAVVGATVAAGIRDGAEVCGTDEMEQY